MKSKPMWAEKIYRYRLPLFYTAALCSLALLVAGLLTDIPYLGAASFGFILLLAVFFDIRMIFYLLMLFLPLSDEISLSEGVRMYVPSEPFAILLMGLGITYALLHPSVLKGRFWKHPVTILILVHFGWSCITTITSTQTDVSIKYVIAKSWYVSVYFFLAAYIINNTKAFKKVFWLLAVSTIGGIVYIMTRHAMTGFLFDEVNAVVRPIFRNHVSYGVWVVAMLPLMLVARSWYQKDTLPRLFLGIAILLTLAAVYFSYTRGAWVALACMPLFYLVVRYRMTRPALITVFTGALIGAAFLMAGNRYLDHSPDYERTIYHGELSDHMSATFQMEDMSTVERFYRWIAAMRMYEEKPWAGFGPGNFVSNYKGYTVTSYRTYISDNEERSSVHNYFLTMLTEQGIPGLIFFVLLIAAILISFEDSWHRAIRQEHKHLILGIACCYLALLVNNVFSDLLEADKLGPLFFICAALAVNLSRGTGEKAVE